LQSAQLADCALEESGLLLLLVEVSDPDFVCASDKAIMVLLVKQVHLQNDGAGRISYDCIITPDNKLT
jgi:hypothetical protein